jgi:hypothetical protein
MKFSRHALDKCTFYGVNSELVRDGLPGDETFFDLNRGGSPARSMCQSLDAETGAILFRHPTVQGIPNLLVEGDGYTMKFMGPTLLCLDIIDPGALGRLLAEPTKQQLPVGLGD